MKLLGIDSSSLVASVAVVTDDVLTAEYTVDFKKTHSQTLLPMIDEVVTMLGMDLHEIDAIAVSGGPGSFTGLRIGSATAKGLGLALEKPLIHVPTVDAMAYNLWGSDALICPIMDARRNQVYTGLYHCRRSLEIVMEQCAMDMMDLIRKLNDMGERVIFLGDEQSIEQNLSTFSAHMTNVISILNQADSHSLCLFDELCAGTDPTEGAALAISILSFLHNMKCRVMATTHYSELKVFALTTPGVENACCEFSVENLQPTYRLLIGIPGKSNAFAISKRLGLPDYIIDDARTHLESNDETFEDLLAHLEESRVTIEKEQEEIRAYKEEVSQLKSRLAQKEERFDERKDKMIRQANEEAQRILREAKETADQTIKNINKLANSSGVGKQLEAERTRLREQLNKVDSKLTIKTKGPKKTISPKALRVGDTVKVLTMGINGTVSTLPNQKGDLYVQMGILRSQVNIKDLELVDEATISGPGVPTAPKNKTGSGKIKMSKSLSVSPEINLIGMTTDEAVPAMEKYLDDAYLAHLPQVRVVHGRGTGALRAACHKRLKKLNYVKEFRLGEYGEGDTGVTIVVFK